MAQQKHTRRDAVKLVAGLSAVFAVPWIVPASVFGRDKGPGPNEQIRIGVIGCGVRGKYLIANMPPLGRVVSLCDCSLGNIDNARKPQGVFADPLARFADEDAPHCSIYQDYRRMLDHEKLDAVMIATPDHHHAQATILACQCGMDVYVEKPLSVTITEGRAMVRAAEKYNRVVQVGSQQRTMEVNRFACEFIRNGGLGNVSLVQTMNFPGPMRYEPMPAESIPKDLAWDLFCGPTPLRPHNKNLWVKDAYKFGYLTWRGWDLFRSYSGHLMTNWGGHSVDMIQYALGVDNTGPIETKLHPEQIDEYTDDHWHEKSPPLGTVKDKALDRMRFCPVSMQYANGTELRFDPKVTETVFHGERGRLFLSRNKYRTDPIDLAPPPERAEQAKWRGEGHVARPHIENWLAAVQDRSQPNAPIEVGHRSATVCHLANITRELRRPLHWDPKAERFVEDEQASTLLARSRRKGFELPRV